MTTHNKGHSVLLSTTIAPETSRRLEAVRGDLPHSVIVERALVMYLTEVTEYKINLLPNIEEEKKKFAVAAEEAIILLLFLNSR
jgi:hypothetical protein